MNQEKIGAFIAKCRKEKGMTQTELAEKIGVTDKSISNWENARCMPDLSLYKSLCDALDISINDFISGERVKTEIYQEKLEENLINTISYSNKINYEKKKIAGIGTLFFGIIITLIASSIFPSESSWSSIYSIVGVLISTGGLFYQIKGRNSIKKWLFTSSYFIVFITFLFFLDYINVVTYHTVPKFSYSIETGEKMIVYKNLFYNAYRINYDTNNEYYIVDTKRKYTSETVPVTPFDREKSGIDALIQYKSKYVGDNSNDGKLIGCLPLSEYGYVFEIDSTNLGLKIDYNITDWYINQNQYLEKGLLYNAVSIFSLIENVSSITFQFSGATYYVDREGIEDCYPQYEEIVKEGFNKEKFNQYVERRMNDEAFIQGIFKQIFT